jgi:hypothetical protein
MRARILYTNGKRTIDLFWLYHSGSDVYWGSPGFAGKTSYHASGKVHSTHGGKRDLEYHHVPLAELKGQFNLSSLSIANTEEWFEHADAKFEYSGKKSDAVLIIDSRAIKKETQFSVSIGLLEPYRMDVLNQNLCMIGAERSLIAQQVLLSTGVVPWVYVILYWWRDTDTLTIASEGEASAAESA